MASAGVALSSAPAAAVMLALARVPDFKACVRLLDDLASRHVPIDTTLYNLALKVVFLLVLIYLFINHPNVH